MSRTSTNLYFIIMVSFIVLLGIATKYLLDEPSKREAPDLIRASSFIDLFTLLWYLNFRAVWHIEEPEVRQVGDYKRTAL